MGTKNPREAVNKASWILMEGMKDTVTSNITAALRAKQLDVKVEHVPTLLALIGASLEEGYHRAFRAFSQTVDQALPLPEPAAKAKKKPL